VILFPYAGYLKSRFCDGQPKNIVSIKHPPPPPPDDELSPDESIAFESTETKKSIHTG